MTISVLQPPTNTFPTNHLIFGKIGFPDAAGTFPVPFPLQFTLQGVMEESPGLLAFTNAVMVDIK